MATRSFLTATALWALADQVERTLARRFLAAVLTAQAQVALALLEAALRRRDLEAALAAIPLGPIDEVLARSPRFTDVVADAAWLAAAGEVAAQVQRRTSLFVSLGAQLLDDPTLRQVIEAQRLSRIQGIRRETEEALRQVLRQGLVEGETAAPPAQLARMVRPLIGITRRQALAVQRYRAQLEADGRPQAQIDRMTSRYARKLLALRAETIARTEAFDALNRAKQLQWERLVQTGAIDPRDWEQEWVTAEDERVCPQCAPFSGTRADIGGWFTATNGDQSRGPTLHPRCRCIVRLVLRGFRVTDRPRRGLREPPAGGGSGPSASPPPRPTGIDATAASETPEQAAKRVAFEREVRPFRIEHGLAVRRDGVVERFTTNAPSSIDFTAAEIRRVQGALLFTHNHPSAGSFSPEDIGFAGTHRIAIIRAVGIGPDGPVTYETDVGRLGRGRAIATAGETLMRSLFPKYNQIYTQRLAAGMPADEAARLTSYEHWHEVWGTIARRFGFSYRRTLGTP